MIEFKQLPPVAGTDVWGAVVSPWSFVITKNRAGRYVASARDVRDPMQVQPRNNLGHDFTTLDAAQDACRQFMAQHK